MSKVSELRKYLDRFDGDDDICVLLWTKEIVDFQTGEELVLNPSGWARICSDFDEMEWDVVSRWVYNSALDYADLAEEAC
jgi:hypothetical protein